MPWDVVLIALSLFAFIFSMIATLGMFFGCRGKWFYVLLACTVVSGICLVVELHRVFSPHGASDIPLDLRPTTPM